MLKKEQVLQALENGGRIMVNSIYRTACVLDANGDEIDSCRYDTAERIEHCEGYTRRNTDWHATWFIEKDWNTASEIVKEAVTDALRVFEAAGVISDLKIEPLTAAQVEEITTRAAAQEEQPTHTFPIITEAAQRAFEDHADGSPDETPAICGTYGRACRQMGQEEGANRALCQGCPLAAFCAANAIQEEEQPEPEYLNERCPNSNEQPGVWYSIEYHYPDGEGPYFFQARTVDDLEDKVAQLLRMGRTVICGWRHDRTTGERRRFIAETRRERTDRENREHCRRIAEELELHATGDAYKCPHCGEVFSLDDIENSEHENEDGDTLYICPNCGEEIDDRDLEILSIYDYFADCLDIEYRCNSKREYKSVCVMVACGGPNIYIDTATKNVELYWWTDRATYPISYDAVEAVDEWAEDLWGCL